MTVKVDCDAIVYSDWLRQSVLVFRAAETAKRELTRLGGIGAEDVQCGAGGAGWSQQNTADGAAMFWMVFDGSASLPTIAHEAVHVADYLCEHAGIPISAENVEVRCYLTEWLFAEVAKALGHKVNDPAAPALRRKKAR